MVKVVEVSVQTLNKVRGHKIVRSVTGYQYSTTYRTAHHVTDLGNIAVSIMQGLQRVTYFPKVRRTQTGVLSANEGAFLRRNYTPPENGWRRQSCPSAL